MKASKIIEDDGTTTWLLEGLTKEDERQLYIRSALTNNDITKAMRDGFGEKKLPDTSFGCCMSCLFTDTWD